MDKDTEKKKQVDLLEKQDNLKNQKDKYMLIIAVLVVLLAACSAFGIIEFCQNLGNQSVSQQWNTIRVDESGDGEGNGVAGSDVENMYNYYVGQDQGSGSVVYQPEQSVIPIYIYKNTLGSEGFAFGSYEDGVDFLEKKGFVKDGDYKSIWGDDIRISTYTKDDLICTLTEKNFSCIYKRELPSEDAYETINEVAEAYKKAVDELPHWIEFSAGSQPAIIVEKSNVYPYQIINADFGNYYSLFYRKDEDSEWVYFAGGQDALSCDAYNTDDLKKAFSGYACYIDERGALSKVSF